MNQKTSTKKIIIVLSILVIVFIVGYFIFNNIQTSENMNINKNSQVQNNQVNPTSQKSDQNSNQEQRIKLSATRYWSHAYLISDDNLDIQAKAALSGFDRKKEILQDGSIKITLKALSSYYNDQTYILKNRENLYFIETSWSDDPQFKEYNLGDDVAVKVDADGYIVK